MVARVACPGSLNVVAEESRMLSFPKPGDLFFPMTQLIGLAISGL